MSKEEQFYSALKSIFVGAEIEGQSGYINLMKIKSRYFQEKVFPQLEKDIEAILDDYPNFRDELFDKLYDFFYRYFSESGSIYFRRTRYPQSVYEQVYSDDKDVILFWKTHMLYYVKTDRMFQSMDVKLDEHTFFFDVSQLDHKQANEKKDLVYRFAQIRDNGTIVFTVMYSSSGSKTKMLDILRALRREDIEIGEDSLDRAFRVFEKQSEVDYFINKDAEKFLKEQFDLWMYQYLFEGKNIWLQRRLEQLQALKDLAYKIIDFIAQFEDELVRIWNKPKFVRNSHYVITLDRIAEKDMSVLKHVLASDGISDQLAEWHQLGMVNDVFELDQIWAGAEADERLDEKYQYLPLDTQHFPDLEKNILVLFDNLDETIDGWLIRSENYQALRTLLPRFREQVQCIYIDPPYNSDSSEIHYENTYKHSSWLTLMENRLFIGKEYLTKGGILSIAIDDNEFPRMVHVVNNHFPERVGVAVIRSNPAGRSTPKGFSLNHEYAVFGAKSEDVSIGRLDRSREQIERYGEEDEISRFEWVNFRKHGGLRDEAPPMFYPIYATNEGEYRIPEMTWSEEEEKWIELDKPKKHEEVLWPLDDQGQERRWKWSVETFNDNPGEVKVDLDQHNQLAIYIKSRMPKGVTPPTWWSKKEYSATDRGTRTLKNLFGYHGSFSYPKAVGLVKDCLMVGKLNQADIALDFFAGSGTTAHAVMSLNREDGGRRKYILVEMADYFDDILLPRVKKVAFSDQWKDGIAQEEHKGMSHFVKYYQLEQYEDVLRRTSYTADEEPFDNIYEDTFQQYVFLHDEKMLHVLEIDQEANEVHVDLSKLYEDIDLAETLANLRGKRIAHIGPDFVEFEDGERIDLKDLDWELIKPLIWW